MLWRSSGVSVLVCFVVFGVNSFLFAVSGFLWSRSGVSVSVFMVQFSFFSQGREQQTVLAIMRSSSVRNARRTAVDRQNAWINWDLRPRQLEVRRRPSAGMMIPPVG